MTLKSLRKMFSVVSVVLSVVLGLTSQSVLAQSASDITDLILVTGQSNVTGSQTDYDSTLDATHPRVFAFTTTKETDAYSTGGTWQLADLHQAWDVDGWHPGNGSISDPARQPYNNFAFHFAKNLADSDPTKIVGVVIASAPGEGIQHWDINGDFDGPTYGDGRTFADVIETQAIAALNAQGVKSSFDAVLWHQGETDWQIVGTSDPHVLEHFANDSSYDPANDPTYYPDNLSALINRFRSSTWFGPGKPFICGETKRALLNQHLRALNTNNDPWTGCVEGSDLSTRDATADHGGTHFDAAGLRTLGQRYSSKYLEMTGSSLKEDVVTIAAIGDSITQGVAGQVSYRVELDSLLSTTGCSYEWTGSRGSAPLLHEGYSGQSVEQFFSNSNPANDRLSTILGSNPDVVLLHLGSNDMRKSQTIQSTITELETVLNRIRAHNSDTAILMANIIPWWGAATNPNVTNDIQSLGTAVENLVAGRTDLNLTLVDVRTGFTRPMMVSDLIHPNKAGEKLIADAFFDTYGLYYDCAQSPDFTAPRTFIDTPTQNESVNGEVTVSGHATDTGASGFNRVRVAVRETNTLQWYSFTTGNFGSINSGGITNATIPTDTRTDDYADWNITVALPNGSYEFFALAEDENGNDAFSGLGIELWPVRSNFTVTNANTPGSVTGFTTQLQSASTGLCIEVIDSSTAPGANAGSGTCVTDAANQTLNFIPVENQTNKFTLEFAHSGMCLNVPGNSTANGASLNQANCDDSSAQQFTLASEGSRIALFTNTGAGNQVIDSHAQTDDIIQWVDFGSNNQRWNRLNLQSTTAPPVTPDPEPDTTEPDDNEAPTTEFEPITSNADGETIISGRASDNVAIDRNRLLIRNRSTGEYWDGGEWVSEWSWFESAGTEEWSYSIGLAAGNYAVTAWTWDTADNRSESISTSLTIASDDSEAPTNEFQPTITSADGVTIISGLASDNVAIDRNRLLIRNKSTGEYWDGEDWVSEWSWFESAGTEEWSYSIELAPGNYTMTAWTWDTTDNRSESISTSLTIAADDSEAPTNEFKPTITNADGVTTISGLASDNVAIDRNRLLIRNRSTGEYWDGEDWVSEWSWFESAGTEEWSYSIELAVGNYKMTAWTWDTVDNRSESISTSLTIASSDIEAPTNEFNPVTTNAEGETVISGLASDNVAIDRNRLLIRNKSTGEYWDGEDWVSEWSWFESAGTEEWSYSIGLTPGNYKTTAWTWDTADNRSESISAGFTIAPDDSVASGN